MFLKLSLRCDPAGPPRIQDDKCKDSSCVLVHLRARLLRKTAPWGVTASYCPGGRTVGRPSYLTLRRLLNAHLTHSLPLWCNPVEVISFTGAFNFSQYGREWVRWQGRGLGLGGGASVFNQPATKPPPPQNQI